MNGKNPAIHTITLKYFQSGHTFMSANNFQHRVEQEMRKKSLED